MHCYYFYILVTITENVNIVMLICNDDDLIMHDDHEKVGANIVLIIISLSSIDLKKQA